MSFFYILNLVILGVYDLYDPLYCSVIGKTIWENW